MVIPRFVDATTGSTKRLGERGGSRKVSDQPELAIKAHSSLLTSLSDEPPSPNEGVIKKTFRRPPKKKKMIGRTKRGYNQKHCPVRRLRSPERFKSQKLTPQKKMHDEFQEISAPCSAAGCFMIYFIKKKKK